jgi:nitroreductase
VLEPVHIRRSLRGGFTEKDIPDAVVDDIVEAGLLAPSSKNAQPWRIHVVRDPAVTAALADAVQHAKGVDDYVPCDPLTGEPRPDWPSTVIESATVLRGAPLALFIENRGEFSQGRNTLIRIAEPDVLADAMIGYTFECIGLGAAILAMWLTAIDHGYGGVFMGDVLIAETAIREALGMNGDLAGVLCLGETILSPHRARVRHDDRVVRHDRAPIRRA